MTLDGHSLLGPDQPGRTPSRLPRDESSRHGRYAAGAHVWPQSEPVTARRTVMRSPDPRPPLLKSGGGRLVFIVMPGLEPGIHVFLADNKRTWITGTRPVMTKRRKGRVNAQHP